MSLRVMQWNCMYSEDVDQIADYIGEVDPDVVCLQELTMGYHNFEVGSGERIAQRLGYYCLSDYGLMVLPDGISTMMGNGILTRNPMTDEKRLTIQQGMLRRYKIVQDERMYLEAAVEAEGEVVRIGTTHLPFHPQFATTPQKLEMTKRIVNEMPVGDVPYIFTADMNATPCAVAVKALHEVAGLRNAGPDWHHNTWTTKPFKIGEHVYQERDWRLDYVFYKGGLEPRRAEILETDLSDHLPIVVEFEVGG